MAYIGRPGATAPLTTADIPDNSITGAKIVAGTIEASDVAADMATQAELDTVSTVASAALPKAGGAMTGAITTNSTFDGVDVAACNTTANAALPKAGGTMTGNIVMGDDTSIGIGDSAERIEFDGAGDISVLGANLGIGTTAPSVLLHIDSDNSYGNLIFSRDGGSGSRRPWGFAISGASDDQLRLNVSNDTTGTGCFGGSEVTAMAWGSDGKVCIGTGTANRKLTIIGDNDEPDISLIQLHNANDNYNEIRFMSVGSDDSTHRVGGSIKAIYTSRSSTNPETNLTFWTRETAGSLTERMRITHDGQVVIAAGSTGINATPGHKLYPTGEFYMNTAGTDTRDQIRFYRDNSIVGEIVTTGTSTAYQIASDYRLKENVIPMSGSIDRLKALKPSRFNFIIDADKTVDGFLAHEAQEIVPEAVTGEKDAMFDAVLYVEGDELPEGKSIGDVQTAETIDPQGIDQSKLVPLLVGALQEAIARIETLENA